MSIFIVQTELNTLPEAALHSKFYSVSQKLAATKSESTERAAALASLDTIKLTIAGPPHHQSWSRRRSWAGVLNPACGGARKRHRRYCGRVVKFLCCPRPHGDAGVGRGNP
jgi:hypothetical protein